MRKVNPATRVVALVFVLALIGTACSKKNVTVQTTALTKGGTFEIVSTGDVDYMDPGQIYYTFSQMLFRVMVRTLVGYAPKAGADSTQLVPDAATDMGTVSPDGMTYTFTIKQGIKYQPEVAGGRQVTSADFRYGIERGFYPSVANGYVGAYFTGIFVGDDAFDKKPAPGTHITGIDVSDPSKIVFHLKKPLGDFLYRIALPLVSPVPEEYAHSFDIKPQSTYGANFASTGPYEIQRDATGKVTGYEPNKKIEMVRNSNWDPKTDQIRTAYPNGFEVIEGFDGSQGTDKILSGQFDYNGDFTIPPPKIATIEANPSQKDQLQINTEWCLRYVALNTAIPPFNNKLIREAVAYVLDRNGMRTTRGGKRLGEIATHILSPGVPGFEEAGGLDTTKYNPFPSLDSTGTPFTGDLAKAEDMMKQAGFSDGKYHGPPVFMVGAAGTVTTQTNSVVQDSLAKIGITVNRQEFKPNTMYTAYYGIPSKNVQVFTNPGWCPDYPDASTVLGTLFDGRKITKSANNDYSLLNDPNINHMIDVATADTNPTQRAKDWAAVDHAVTESAAVIPWLWDNTASLLSKRVKNFQFVLPSSSIDLAVVALDVNAKP
ncbi:MAG: ABC transporter substrate-binding protein [Actinomycetota bacterium]